MPPPSDPAREALNVPGILMMVFGGLMILSSLFGLVSSALTGNANQDALRPLMDDPNIPANLKQMLATMTGPGAKLINLLSMALSGFMAFGGFQMRNLKNYPLCMAACIVAMLPCTSSCCCIFTMPVGIWALVTMMKPEIKNAFT